MKVVDFRKYTTHKVKLPNDLRIKIKGEEIIAPIALFDQANNIDYTFDVGGSKLYNIRVDTRSLTDTGFYISLRAGELDSYYNFKTNELIEDDIVELNDITPTLCKYATEIEELENC